MNFFFIFFGINSIFALAALFDLELIEAEFKELSSHKTTCAYNALKDFSELCRENGAENMNAELRLLLAVKLSLCEFIEAGLEFPATCDTILGGTINSVSSYRQCQECIAAFRAVPQLWTTYSGNYRKLRLLCFEEQAPFMKDSILDLFLNITKLYSRFYDSAQDATLSMEFSQEETTRRLRELQSLIESIFHQIRVLGRDLVDEHKETILMQKSNQESVLDQFQIMNAVMTNILYNSSRDANNLRERIGLARNSFVSFNDAITESNLQTSNSLEMIDKQHQKLVESAKASSHITELMFNSLNSLEFSSSGILSKIDQIHDKIEVINTDLTAKYAAAGLNINTSLELFHEAVTFEVQKMGEATIFALDPVLSRIATIGLQLESKLLNASSMVNSISVELKNLESKMSLIPNMSFLTFGEFVGWIILPIKVLGLLSIGFIIIIILKNLLETSFSDQIATEAISYLMVFVVGFLVACSVRLWFHGNS